MLSLAQWSRQAGCLGAPGGVIAARRLPLSARRVGAPSEGMHCFASFSRQDYHRKKPISALAARLYRFVLSATGKGETSTQWSSVWSCQHVAGCGGGGTFLHCIKSSRDSVTL